MIRLVVLLLVSLTVLVYSNDEQRFVDEFKVFVKRHKKRYRNGTVEEAHFRRWKKRKSLIDAHNRNATRGLSSFVMDDNHLADLSHAEWNDQLLGMAPLDIEESVGSMEESNSSAELTDLLETKQAIPVSVDLRNVCMPPVKTQSPCGACWAFTAATAVEYQNCIRKNSTPVILSEQHLIDCSTSFGSKGCGGGFYTQAWNYVIDAGGLMSNSSYPYKATNGACQFVKGVSIPSGTLTRFVALAKNETAMQRAVVLGPVTVSIVANEKFILYRSGIFDDDTCKNDPINHGVTLVGYGTANGTDYWIARNSWGTAWGRNGYILMKRNVNICRITEFPFYASL